MSSSRSLRTAAGQLWRLDTHSPALNPRKIPSKTVAKRWKSLEGIHKRAFRSRRHSAGNQTTCRRRKPAHARGGGFWSPPGLPGQTQDGCGCLFGTPRHHTPVKSDQRPLQSVGNRWKAPSLQFPSHGSTLLTSRRSPGVASRCRRGGGGFCQLLGHYGSRRAPVRTCRALPVTIPSQNAIENRCKALEIVGRHPRSSFPATGALCRRPGDPQASQAGAGE